jgi:nucleoside-diphosphate-sugar epimerase
VLVAVTGGSGFVGSHTVARLIAHGHRPRVLVRDRGAALQRLAARGVAADEVDLVTGDMLDAAAVDALLSGAEGVVHAAAAIGVTAKAHDVYGQNVGGTEQVVGGAVARGIDPIVHVSTVTVFVPSPSPVITVDGPLASPRGAYGRSKVAAERYVRRLQDAGAPITTVYPGGVIGPGQPGLDGLMRGLATAVTSVLPVPRGGVGIVHVGDVAEVLARCVVPGRGARRLMLGGAYVSFEELIDLCSTATGRHLRKLVLPGRVLTAVGAVTDVVSRVRPTGFPLTRDAAEIMNTLVRSDDRPTLEALEMALRPPQDAVADAIAALFAEGHISRRAAGRAVR